MKQITTILLLTVALLLPAAAQEADTNTTTTIPNFLGTVWNTAVGQGMTNLGVAVVETFTPSINKWGTGVIVTRNIPLGGGISTGIGVGLDCYDSHFYALNGQVSLKADLLPLSGFGTANASSFGSWLAKTRVSPFGYIGLGTPFDGGSSINAGGQETIQAVGAAVALTKVLGGNLNLIGLYGTRQGLGDASGTFYGGGVDLNWAF